MRILSTEHPFVYQMCNGMSTLPSEYAARTLCGATGAGFRLKSEGLELGAGGTNLASHRGNLMSIIIHCNRCGRQTTAVGEGVMPGDFVRFQRHSCKSMAFDLCGDCAAELKKWLNGAPVLNEDFPDPNPDSR